MSFLIVVGISFMDRRLFIGSISSLGLLSLSGCNFFPSGSKPTLLNEPLQVNIDPVELSPGVFALAHFSAEVLVLSTKKYPLDSNDVLSVVSPLDIAVAWSDAATPEARKAVELTQSERRYHWRARTRDMKKPGVGDFTKKSGNWHMVPADDDILGQLESLKPDQTVLIEGDLIQVFFQDGTFYKSSLVRDDTGDGACEIILTRKVSVTS